MSDLKVVALKRKKKGENVSIKWNIKIWRITSNRLLWNLSTYTAWYKGLTEEENQEWWKTNHGSWDLVVKLS